MTDVAMPQKNVNTNSNANGNVGMQHHPTTTDLMFMLGPGGAMLLFK